MLVKLVNTSPLSLGVTLRFLGRQMNCFCLHPNIIFYILKTFEAA